ncbi:MAG: class I SAM-dependent methyltransferase, partial [Deltaproteobacteria bacterium]|nr:class I SAM-dependent methyltransferase [Deltaproteobacteria bacterium]
QALDLMPDDPRIIHALAEVMKRQGNYGEAYRHFRGLHDRGESSHYVQGNLLFCLRNMPQETCPPETEQHAVEYLDFVEVEHNELAPFIARLIKQRYGLEQESAHLNLGTLAEDDLFMKALKTLYFTDPAMEKVLVQVRKHLLVESLVSSSLDSRWVNLVAGIALHNAGNEYVHPIDPEEQEMVKGLEELLCIRLSCKGWRQEDILGLILLYAMYKPLHALSAAESLTKYPMDQWDQTARPVLERTLLDPLDEMRRARSIESLSEIHDPVSLAVQMQYEENPYPRWLSLNVMDAIPPWQVLQNDLPGFRAPRFLHNGDIRILVAGCGTGRQALQVASLHRDGTVLAVDISRRSLAYAQRMAERYDIRNVEFLQADILDLDKLDRDFHMIQCSGVLHHMKEPKAGWAVLRRILAPKGLMKIGLYSEAARRHITSARSIIRRLGLKPVADDIRRFRSIVMIGELGEVVQRLLRSPDFYGMSDCRDLLFHVQEHHFTVGQIGRICDELDLVFLGFVNLMPKIRQTYRFMFPSDSRMTDLTHWETFENILPGTFSRMYNFWCQARELH